MSEWDGLTEFMSPQQRATYDAGLAYAVGGPFTDKQAEVIAGMAVETPTVGRRATKTSFEGYCTCGHDRDAHRRSKCWTGWDGNPVAYKPSLIACPCTGWEAS